MLAGLVAGGALQSATGFGFSLIASPVLVGAYGGAAGITALTLVSVAINVLTLGTERRRPGGDWGAAGRIVAWFVPGAVLGGLVLRAASDGLLDALVAGSVLLAIAVRLAPTGELRVPASAAGLLGGAFGMATGVSGPPILLHLLGTGAAPGRIRDTLAAIFLATAVLGLAILGATGTFSVPGALALLVLAAGTGHVLGRRVFARLGPTGYERLVLTTMGTSALASLLLLVR